jgi:hypothetical protein
VISQVGAPLGNRVLKKMLIILSLLTPISAGVMHAQSRLGFAEVAERINKTLVAGRVPAMSVAKVLRRD